MTSGQGSAALETSRLMLLIESASNRRLLGQMLRQHYQPVEPSDASFRRIECDVIIADPKGLQRYHAQVHEARVAQFPTLLPVILLVTRGEIRTLLAHFRDLVDEFIVLPADRLELTTRLHLWMRARRLSLQQRDDLAYLVNHDRLTGLPLRPLLIDHLDQALAVAVEQDQQMSLQIVEVSGKALLMSLSPAGRDQALVELTNRLGSLLDAQTRLACLGEAQWGLLHPPAPRSSRSWSWPGTSGSALWLPWTSMARGFICHLARGSPWARRTRDMPRS